MRIDNSLRSQSLRSRSAFVFAVALLMLGAGSQKPGGTERLAIDLRAFQASGQPRILISAVEERSTFPANQTRQAFEEFLTKSGADYQVQVLNRELCQAIAGDLSMLALRAEPDGAASIDIRYRLDFFDDQKQMGTLYVGRFARLQEHERVLVPIGDQSRFLSLMRRIGSLFSESRS